MALELLGSLSNTLATARTLEELTRPLLTLLELMTGMESTYLTRIDLDAGVQTVLYARNSHNFEIPEGLSVPWGDTLCKRALDEGRPFNDDVAGCWGDSDAARALGIATYVSTPLRHDDGTIFGTLCAAASKRCPIDGPAREALAMFGALIEQQIRREQLLERLTEANRKLERQSLTDPLTELPNRRYLMEEMNRLFALGRRTGRQVLVAFIDLDGFKAINDTRGHDAGDAFLVEVGRRLADALRASDVLARLGGDEFVMAGLAADVDHDADEAAGAMHARLAPLLVGRFALDNGALDYMGASIGVVAVDPERYTPEEAVRRADAMMYEDKRARRGLIGMAA